jgi:hypothetical protein
MQLGQALSDRYWRIGPGSVAALPDLSAAIDVMKEAYSYIDPADAMRGQLAGLLGWLLAARHSAHGSGPGDREDGIDLLGTALTFPNLPPMLGAIGRVTLGQLYLSRVTDGMRWLGIGASGMFAGPPSTRWSIPTSVLISDRCLRWRDGWRSGPPARV